MESCIPIASSRYRNDVEYSTMPSEFLQVRGTPASGKSTLAKLLGRHIHVQEPDVRVIWIGGWKLDDVAKCGGWYSYLKKRKGWIPGEDTVFIFDEAQVTYKDGELWNELFKGIHDYPDRRAIAFASYGSPSSFIDIEGTPIFVAPTARVSLLPTAHNDNLPAAGLLFTRAEFDELVSKQYPYSEYHFHPSFLDMVFGITEGHVGAMYSFLHIILGSDVCTFSLTRS
jgi:energy-coupling factor transporter ATP-binding protein EcfA2